MKSEIQALTKSQQNEITQLNNTINHFKNRVQSNVAFTAGILGETNGQHTYASGDIVKFPKFIYQVGGGYNPTTGVFTAPKTGLYIIFCTNVAAHQQVFYTQIMINGSPKAGVLAYVHPTSAYIHQSASNLVVHQLQVGDRVWIQVYDGGHLYSNIPDTTLSVVMINGSD
ncbi:adiponectin-like [Saccostrea cucullata]|uniref:adiponectin-like n=1 Tax=Saccostrea cuccullata TaxID=36930 RepID=UPI002ED15019